MNQTKSNNNLSNINDDPEFSIIIPVFNESANIYPLTEEISVIAQKNTEFYEIIYIDDGSSDNTWERIKAISQVQSKVKGLRFTRNFGHQAALVAGLTMASGKAVISMDGDFQHPPNIISILIEKWRNGADVVQALRIDAPETTYFKKSSSRIYYWLYAVLANQPMNQGQSDFRLIDRKVVITLLNLPYSQPFLRGTLQWLGYSTQYVSYNANIRRHGKSRFSLRKMLNLGYIGIVSNSSSLLYLSLTIGGLTLILSIIYALFAFAAFSAGIAVPGWTSLVALLSFMFSTLLISQGVLSLYVNDIHSLVKQRPHFIIHEAINLHKG